MLCGPEVLVASLMEVTIMSTLPPASAPYLILCYDSPKPYPSTSGRLHYFPADYGMFLRYIWQSNAWPHVYTVPA